jgi:hypothetical protein
MTVTLAATRPQLTAATLAQLIREAGVPCATLVPGEAAAAAIPATREQEGLRIVDGSMPVRIAYPIPADDPGHYGALRRRDGHVLWLFDWVEQYRWSAHRGRDDEWITIHPGPRPATYELDGRERFRATGRDTAENLGSWVVLWVVYNADAWADAIEADVTKEIARAPKNRRAATYMQQQRLDSAERLRADPETEGPRRPGQPPCRGCGEPLQRDQTGYYVEYDPGPGYAGKLYRCAGHSPGHSPADRPARRTVRSTELDQERADAHVTSLYSGCPNPGVRYEAAPITAHGACVTCYCPMFEADGQWWHHTGRYPAECGGPRTGHSLPLEPGDWEFSAVSMTCGYCGHSISWPELQRSWVKLTGAWSLGVQLAIPETGPPDSIGALVVLAETEGIAQRPGKRDVLPHHCDMIPDSVRAEYAGDVAAIMAAHTNPGPATTGEP